MIQWTTLADHAWLTSCCLALHSVKKNSVTHQLHVTSKCQGFSAALSNNLLRCADNLDCPGSCGVAGSTGCGGEFMHGLVAGWSGRQRGNHCADTALLARPVPLHKCAHSHIKAQPSPVMRPVSIVSKPDPASSCLHVMQRLLMCRAWRTLKYISSHVVYGADRSADVKRCYTMRHALSLLDFEDATIDDLKRLVLRAAFSPTFLRCKEGRRYLAHLFTLEVCPIASSSLRQNGVGIVIVEAFQSADIC